MDQSLRIELDQLRALSPEFARIAQAAQQELTTLETGLAVEGRCWGDDEPGRMFGEQYEPQAEDGKAALRTVIERLSHLGAGLTGAADTFEDADASAAERVRDSADLYAVPEWRTPTESTGPGVPASDAATAAPATVRHPTNPSAGAPEDLATTDRADGTYPPGTAVDSAAMPTAALSNRTAPPAGSVPEETVPTGAYAPFFTSPRQASGPPSALPARPDPPAGSGVPPSVSGGTSGAGRRGPAPAAMPSVPSSVATTGATPWQRRPEQSSPGSPEKRPAVGPGRARAQVSVPGVAGAAPPPATPSEKKGKPESGGARPKDIRAQPARRPAPAEPEALEILEVLAARHQLRITGFAYSGIDVPTARDIAAAVDDILGRYQFVDLAGLAVDTLPNGRASCLRWEEQNEPPSRGWIVFQQFFADSRTQHPVGRRGGSAVAEVVPERPMYTGIIHHFGELLADSAGTNIMRRAERMMLTEYYRISGPWNDDTLAAVTRGYRAWRSRLGPAGSATGRPDPRSMLAAGFAEVELQPNRACGPAKVLHRVLLETMRGRPAS